MSTDKTLLRNDAAIDRDVRPYRRRSSRNIARVPFRKAVPAYLVRDYVVYMLGNA